MLVDDAAFGSAHRVTSRIRVFSDVIKNKICEHCKGPGTNLACVSEFVLIEVLSGRSRRRVFGRLFLVAGNNGAPERMVGNAQ